MKAKLFSVVLVVLCGISFSSNSSAQATRTWVSGIGDDANPCSRTAPCKTFAGAISKTAALGVINTLDGGGFGAVTITKSITIEGNSDIAGILASGTNGIIINAAATDKIILRNIQFNGVGTGLNGVRILNAAEVEIDNCTFSEFDNSGVSIANTNPVKVVIRNSVFGQVGTLAASFDGAVRTNGTAGMRANVLIDQSQINALTFGVVVEQDADVIIRNSTITGGANKGVLLRDLVGTTRKVWIENSTISNFTSAAIESEGTNSVARLTDSTITDNGIGLSLLTGGQIESFGDNRLFGNVSDGSFTATQSKR